VTLNITLLTPVTIYQSADFRLTDPSDASFIRDESAKTVVLHYMTWAGFVTYTGIGSWNGENLSEIVADWLTDIHTPSMADLAAIIERKGTRLIKELERRNHIRFQHTFTLAGFEDGLARALVISNFEDCLGRTRLTDNHLTTTVRELGAGSKATVIVTGRPRTVPNTEKRILRKLAVQSPLDGGLIRTRMQELNAQASTSPESENWVSQDCAVISFRFDGFGILQPSQAPDIGPKHIPIISNGINQHKSIADAMAKIGLDMSNAQMGNVTFVSTHEPGPPGSLQSTCKFPVKGTESSGGYEIVEITGSDSSRCSLAILMRLAISSEQVAMSKRFPGRRPPASNALGNRLDPDLLNAVCGQCVFVHERSPRCLSGSSANSGRSARASRSHISAEMWRRASSRQNANRAAGSGSARPTSTGRRTGVAIMSSVGFQSSGRGWGAVPDSTRRCFLLGEPCLHHRPPPHPPFAEAE
jgi:hypothetical protein